MWKRLTCVECVLVAVVALGGFSSYTHSSRSPLNDPLDYNLHVRDMANEIDQEDLEYEDEYDDDNDEAEWSILKLLMERISRLSGRTLIKNFRITRERDDEEFRRAASLYRRTDASAAARRLYRLLTVPRTSCKRLVKVGGRTCVGAYDGAKLVCLDATIKLKARQCLVYSFGVGNDFSFDEHMQDFGCEVHAFDHDVDHEAYNYRLGPLLFFHKVRLGYISGYFRFCEESPDGTKCENAVHYLTMSDTLRMLGHEGRDLNYLKMDIEGAEWLALRNVLQNTTLLEKTSQLSLEVHFDDLRKEETLEGKQQALIRYLQVFEGLNHLGFKLVKYEENLLNPQYEEVDGIKFNLYAEILMIKE